MNSSNGMRYNGLSALFCFCFTIAIGQSTFAPLDKDYYNLVDRYMILSDSNDVVYTSFKPYEREDIYKVAVIQRTNDTQLSAVDKFNLSYLIDDNWEFNPEDNSNISDKPILKHLYRRKSDMFHVKTGEFDLHLSPIFHFGLGKENADVDQSLFVNTRGIKIRGSIDKKLSFFTSLTENQALFPRHIYNYSQERIAVPGFGFWKSYNDTGFDFIDARGYINFSASKHINIQFGQDKNFIGNGKRSFILSDFGPSYPFLKIRTKIWKFQYTNLYAQLISDADGNVGGSYGVDRFPKKFFSLHHLSVNVSKRMNIGLFESIVTRGGDSTGVNTFELSYLNPIIFYRAVEQQSGSPDNTLLGMDFKWNTGKRLLVFGQFGLDELVVSKLFGGQGAWENKFFVQLGFNHLNLFNVNNLDVSSELNIARPYLYSHNSTASYSHFNQPLAHPLGANFYEIVSELNFRPIPRMTINGNFTFAKHGMDDLNAADSNFGRDIFKSNENIARDRPLGNKIGQGVATSLHMINVRFSYMLKHNLFIDIEGSQREITSDSPVFESSSQYFSMSIRLNSPVLTFNY